MDAKSTDLLRKLHTLMESPHAGEAEAALHKVKALLARHNKRMSDIPELLGQPKPASRSYCEPPPPRPKADPPPKASPPPSRRGSMLDRLIPLTARAQMLANWEASRLADKRLDHRPVVRLTGQYIGAVWLTEMRSDDEDIVYGLLVDISASGNPVAVGSTTVSRLIELFKPSRDEMFHADRPLSAYVAEKRAKELELAADNARMNAEFEQEDAQARADAAQARREAEARKAKPSSLDPKRRIVEAVQQRAAQQPPAQQRPAEAVPMHQVTPYHQPARAPKWRAPTRGDLMVLPPHVLAKYGRVG